MASALDATFLQESLYPHTAQPVRVPSSVLAYANYPAARPPPPGEPPVPERTFPREGSSFPEKNTPPAYGYRRNIAGQHQRIWRVAQLLPRYPRYPTCINQAMPLNYGDHRNPGPLHL